MYVVSAPSACFGRLCRLAVACEQSQRQQQQQWQHQQACVWTDILCSTLLWACCGLQAMAYSSSSNRMSAGKQHACHAVQCGGFKPDKQSF
jgi:hypothetical protein